MSDNGGLKELQVDGISWCFNTDNCKNLVSLFDRYTTNSITVEYTKFDKKIKKYTESQVTESYTSIFKKLLNLDE